MNTYTVKYGRVCMDLWRHKKRRTTFTLSVYDFGNTYFTEEDLNHLLNALKTHYIISVDPTGAHYCGLHIDWKYEKQYADISMPGYITKALHKFQHPTPKKLQYVPHSWIPHMDNSIICTASRNTPSNQ